MPSTTPGTLEVFYDAFPRFMYSEIKIAEPDRKNTKETNTCHQSKCIAQMNDPTPSNHEPEASPNRSTNL